MTTALGLAAVTSVVRAVLSEGIISHNVSGMLGSTVGVSVAAPDRVIPATGVEPTQLNLFLYRVTPNPGWRNVDQPSRDERGRRIANPPLALDLHYLVSAYGSADLHAEVLLGFAMHWLHETPLLTRDRVRAALTPSPPPGSALARALEDSGLADQIEMIKITPEGLDSEEMSKLWSAAQTQMRPTAAYVATVLLIQAGEPIRAPLPVLSRGAVDAASQRDRGVVVRPDLLPPLPMLETVVPAGGQPVVRLGEVVDLSGHHLDGNGRTVLLGSDRFAIEEAIAAIAGNEPGSIRFAIPTARAADFPVGVYRVAARVQRPGEGAARETNRLALTLAPELTGLPINVVRDGAGTASFTVGFHPAVRDGQRVSLVLGQQEYLPQPFVAPTTTLNFVIVDAPPSPPPPPGQPPGHLARLRVDGIDSLIIDHAASPPVFRNQRVVIS